MREVVFEVREDRSQVYLPERCIGCGTCVAACPKGELVIGSVGAVARGVIDRDFLSKGMAKNCVFCAVCARVCPRGALEFRRDGKREIDDGYLHSALSPTTVNDYCVHCGLCEEVCPQRCIKVEVKGLAQDGSLNLEGETIVDQDRCVHCGWCAAVCPTRAISVKKPFSGEFSRDDGACQACRTCISVCPAGALFNRRWGQGERVEKVTHRPGACLSCGACALACPVSAITVSKTGIIPDVKGKGGLLKRISGPAIRPALTSILVTDEQACLGCGNCVIACRVNAMSDAYLAAGHLNEVDEKPLLEVENGSIKVVNQDLCGSCGTCSIICPVQAVRLKSREAI